MSEGVDDSPDSAGEIHFAVRAGQEPLQIGVVWSGSVAFGKEHRRTQRLLQFFQAFALPGIQLYSLQKGLPAAEFSALPRDRRFQSASERFCRHYNRAARSRHHDR